MFSWVFALTQTPFFIQEFVRRPRPEELKAGLFDGKYYNIFRNALRWVLRHRTMTVASLVVMLVLSAWSFKFIPKVFVPALDKQYFTMDMWLPEGTNIYETDRIAGEWQIMYGDMKKWKWFPTTSAAHRRGIICPI